MEEINSPLRSLRIGNFKAFAATQNIPIRPLTLIYGANSAGKSTVLHALLLGCQGARNGEFDTHLTDVGGDSVDLGGFKQYVHRTDPKRRVQWGIDLATSAFDSNTHEFLMPFGTITVVLGIGSRGGGAYVSRIELSTEAIPLLVLHSIEAKDVAGPNATFMGESVNLENPALRTWLNKRFIETTGAELSSDDWRFLTDSLDSVCDFLAFSNSIIPAKFDWRTDEDEVLESLSNESPFVIPESEREEWLIKLSMYFIGQFFGPLLKEIDKTLQSQIGLVRYLGPLRSYPPRQVFSLANNDFTSEADGAYAWALIGKNREIEKNVNLWLTKRLKLNTPYRLKIRRLVETDFVVRALRQAFQSTPFPVSKACHSKLVRQFRKALEGTKSSEDKGFEVLLVDQRTKTVVSHRDVGAGISQVLPILVAALATRGHIHVIEQPELHLHPALQAELGDLFIESALEEKNTFLLETHSEHLLLRIMSRMRRTHEGTLKEGESPLTPEDVSIVFVEPGKDGSVVREMPLNARGELVKDWPGGFFEEGLREVLI